MKRFSFLSVILFATIWSASAAFASDATVLRFLCFEDGNECEAYQDMLSRFTADNPGITIVVDVVPQEGIEDRLLAQVEADAAPDIARVSELNALAGYYLDLRPLLMDGDTLEAKFRAVYLNAMRDGPDDEGLYGYPDALDMVAPFVNVSLFEQAGVVLPDDSASWNDWLTALEQVASATGASYALAVDNKDHRLAGPAMSLGAQYFDADGSLTLPDDSGLRAWLETLTVLLEADLVPTDVLTGTGKSQDYFVHGATVMYICGSWKAGQVAEQVGDDFDWTIVPNPAGEAGGAGVAQAAGLVAFAATEHPQAVAKVFEYLLQPALLREFAARTLTIPANDVLASAGIEYAADNEAIAAALNGFARETPALQDQAIALDLHPLARVYYDASNMNLRAYFAGDLTLDEALAGLRQALDEADAAAASP